MMHPSIWMHWTNLDSSLSGKYASKLNSMPVLQETHPYISQTSIWLMKILSHLSFVALEFDDQIKCQHYYSVYATSPDPYHHHHTFKCISANWSLSTFHVHTVSISWHSVHIDEWSALAFQSIHWGGRKEINFASCTSLLLLLTKVAELGFENITSHFLTFKFLMCSFTFDKKSLESLCDMSSKLPALPSR